MAMEELNKILMGYHMSHSFQNEREGVTVFGKNPKKPRKLRPGLCEYCNKWFSDKGHLYAHKRIHTGEKPFVCSVCLKGFNQNSNLRRHFEIHTARKPLRCNICERQFIDKQHFKDHVRAHSGLKPYICKVCNKAFAYRNTLVCHRLTHRPTYLKKKKVTHIKVKEIKFFCEVCKEGFVYESLLRYHMRLHNTKIKCYQCIICKRVFSRRSRFHSHLLTIHNIKVAFQCKKCNKRFPNNQDLEKHYLYDHKAEELQTVMQNEIIGNESNEEIDTVKQDFLSEIIKDIKVAFLCKICNDLFPDKEALGKHLCLHNKSESTDLQKKEANRTESDKEIEYNSMKRSLSEILKDIKITFLCKICNDLFPDTEALEKHLCHNKEGKTRDKRKNFTQENFLDLLPDKENLEKHLCHNKEGEAEDKQKTNITECEKDIEYSCMKKGHISELYSVAQKEVKTESWAEHEFENCITQNNDLGEVYFDSEDNVEIQTQLEHNFENGIAQNKDVCEVYFVSEDEIEIQTELDHKFENNGMQHSDSCQLPDISQEQIEIEPEQRCKIDITQAKYLCEKSSGSLDELEVKIEPTQFFNNIIKNRYLCGICYGEFSCITSMQEHLRTHTLQCIFVCGKCREYFHSKSLLIQHACCSEYEIEHLECYICEETFSRRDDLKKHLSRHTNGYICSS